MKYILIIYSISPIPHFLLFINFNPVDIIVQTTALDLIFPLFAVNIYLHKPTEVFTMSEEYGSDFMTIVDEDGTEFELEILTTLEYNGATYLAVTPANGEEDEDLEVSILKSVDEDGEDDPILCAIEDDEELETVYNLIMEQLYEEEDEED